MDGFPRYELFGSKVARKFDYGIQDPKCGDPSQQQSKETKDTFWDDGDSPLYDEGHKVHLREKPDWLVTMSLPDTDELFGFYFRRSYLDYTTTGLAHRDLALHDISGCDSSECSHKSDSDRRRKTFACLVLGIGALGILAGIIAVIFIMIMSRPPDPITGGFVNITNPSPEENYTSQKPSAGGPSHDSDLHSRTQPSALVTKTANIGTATTATFVFSPDVFTKGLVTNSTSRFGSQTAPSAFTSTAGVMDPLPRTSAPTLTETTAVFFEARTPEFSSTLQTSWRPLEAGFGMTVSVPLAIGNTADTLVPPGITNTLITSVPPSAGSTVNTSAQSRNASILTTPVSLATENSNTILVTTTGYTVHISPIVTAAKKTVTSYLEDSTIIASTKLISENMVIASAAMPTTNTVITSAPLKTENTYISSLMANTIITSPPLATRSVIVLSSSLVTQNTNITSMPQVTENTVIVSALSVSENTDLISVPTTAVNTIITLVAPLPGAGSVTSTPSLTEKTVATSAAQMSLVPSTSIGGTWFEFSSLKSNVLNNTPPYASPTPVVTATPATATLPLAMFSSDPGISEGISSSSGFPGWMSSNSSLSGGISTISTAVITGASATAIMTPSMSVTTSMVINGSSAKGKSDVVLTLMSAATGSSITTGTATQRPDTFTRTTVDPATTTTTTSGSPGLSSHTATTPSIVTSATTAAVAPPTSAPVALLSAASATTVVDTIIYTTEQSTSATVLQQITTRTDLITTTSLPFTGAKIVSLATGPSAGIAATPVVTTVLPTTIVLSTVTVVAADRATHAATATSTETITITMQGTVDLTTIAVGAKSTFMTTPVPTLATFQPSISSATATTTTTTTVLTISSTASLTTLIPASTVGRLVTTDHSSSLLTQSSSLGPADTVSASLLPSTTSETMGVSAATSLLPTTASVARLAPVSTNTITTPTAIKSTPSTPTAITSTPPTPTAITSTPPTPTASPDSINSPNLSTNLNPTMFSSLLSTTAVLRTFSLNATFNTAVVVATLLSSSPPTTTLTPSSSSLALASTLVTTPATGFPTSTATVVTTTIPTTTTPPMSEILFMDTVLQLYQPGMLSCTHIGNDWSFVVLIRNDTETIAGYQNVFGCTQMVGCNTFLNDVNLQETNVGFNNTFTLTFNNVSCSDQRLYTCQEVIVGLTANAFVKVEVPKSLQRLEISVPSAIRSASPTSVSCSARLEAETGAVFWEIADPGDSTFVPVNLTGASQTETRVDECLRDVTLRANHIFSASQKGARLRCRTISPNAVSSEVVLNIV